MDGQTVQKSYICQHDDAQWKLCRIGQQKQKIMEKQKYKSSLGVFFWNKVCVCVTLFTYDKCLCYVFLSRVNMQCMQSAILFFQFCPSVCPSNPGTTGIGRTDRWPVLCQITFLWRSGRGITLVFIIPPPLQNSKGKHWPFNWPFNWRHRAHVDDACHYTKFVDHKPFRSEDVADFRSRR